MLGFFLGCFGALANFFLLGLVLARSLQSGRSSGLFCGISLLCKFGLMFLLLGAARYLSIKIVAQEVVLGMFIAAVSFIALVAKGKLFCFKR